MSCGCGNRNDARYGWGPAEGPTEFVGAGPNYIKPIERFDGGIDQLPAVTFAPVVGIIETRPMFSGPRPLTAQPDLNQYREDTWKRNRY